MGEYDLALDAAALAEAKALHEAAVARGDTAVAQRLGETMRALSADAPESMEVLANGLPLVDTKRWEEARDLLASLDRAQLPRVERPSALAILAHLNAMAGDGERATELVLDALREVEAMGADYPREKLVFLQGTHALALLLGGKADEVVALLRPLVAVDATNRVRAGHAYLLGMAYLALGREDEAKRLFENTAAGEATPFVVRAKRALVGLERASEAGDDPAPALAAAYEAARARGDLAEAEELSTMMRLLAEDRARENAGGG